MQIYNVFRYLWYPGFRKWASVFDMEKKEAKRGVPPMAQLPDPEEIDLRAVLDSYLAGKIDLICVLGPTASGKTRYAVSLCRSINAMLAADKGRDPSLAGAEILSADSRQVYRGMDIGTGKDLCEYGEIPYHLIDIVEAGSRYNIYDYQKDFEKAYADIRNRGGVPVLCGGSGLYIEAATCGYALPEMAPDMEARTALEALEHDELRRRLLELAPDTAASVLESKRRTVRALELAIYGQEHPIERTSPLPKNCYHIGTLVSREERNARIDRRLAERMEEGMADEVRTLLESGIKAEDLLYYGLEYKFVTQYVLGILSLEEMTTLLSNAIHQFAKRQMTWFRGMERDGIRIHWTLPR